MKQTIKRKKLLWLALLPVVALTFLSSCKKGKDDPFLSLRSRKARVVAEWTLTGYAVNGSNQNLTGTTKYNFKKDGTGEMSLTVGSISTTEKFRWDFLGGNGDYKKKERLVIYESDGIDGDVYEIVMLKNEEMKWHTESKNGSNTDKEDYTLEVK